MLAIQQTGQFSREILAFSIFAGAAFPAMAASWFLPGSMLSRLAIAGAALVGAGAGSERLVSSAAASGAGAGCALTGSGSLLPGMLDVTESQLRVPARAALPVRLSQMPAELVDPGFSVAVGMILYANRTRMKRAAEKPSLVSRLHDVFAGNF